MPVTERLLIPHFQCNTDDESAPALINIHDSYGISGSLLRLSQRLAGDGFTVCTPDLYFRMGGTKSKPWRELRAGFVLEQAVEDVTAVARKLRSDGAPRVGIVGFCLGGGMAYRMALEDGVVDAAVGFYGASVRDMLSRPKVPVQLIYGRRDHWVPPETIERIVAHHPDTIVYEDAGHGFMRDQSEEYVERAAEAGYARAVAFFQEHLHGDASDGARPMDAEAVRSRG